VTAAPSAFDLTLWGVPGSPSGGRRTPARIGDDIRVAVAESPAPLAGLVFVQFEGRLALLVTGDGLVSDGEFGSRRLALGQHVGQVGVSGFQVGRERIAFGLGGLGGHSRLFERAPRSSQDRCEHRSDGGEREPGGVQRHDTDVTDRALPVSG